MLKIFKVPYLFAILYFIVLLIDISFKFTLKELPCRFISKPLVVILLICYYLINNQEIYKKLLVYMIMALLCFLVGDFFMFFYEIQIYYIVGILCFILGKLFYIFRFSKRKDFDLVKLLAIIIPCFLYMLLLLILTYENLGNFFYPTLLYLFVVVTLIIFAHLRKQSVNFKSYVLVLVGVIFSLFSDSITIISSFYDATFAYNKVSIMLFYGISQYFIVIGIVEETKSDAFVVK